VVGDYCRGDHVYGKSTGDPVNTTKAFGEVEIKCNSVLATALDEAEWSALCSGCFTLDNNLIGGWMGSRIDLDNETGRFWFIARTNQAKNEEYNLELGS